WRRQVQRRADRVHPKGSAYHGGGHQDASTVHRNRERYRHSAGQKDRAQFVRGAGSGSRALRGSALIKRVARARFSRESSPGGATELSPALQRWEKWEERFKSRRDDRVLTHTLQRWGKSEQGFNSRRDDRSSRGH